MSQLDSQRKNRDPKGSCYLAPKLHRHAWIYMDDEIVCLAKAQELQRKDGSYRLWR
jgi:hypothetical protein